MENIKLDTMAGDSIHNVIKKCKAIAREKEQTVEFDFNGILCLVNNETEPDLLYRDYCNSHLMDWKIIGPVCDWNYSSQTLFEMAKKREEQELKESIRREETRKKDQQERDAFDKSVLGIEFDIVDNDGYLTGKSKNTDGYGACIYEYAEGWARLMQGEIAHGKSVSDVAEKTSFMMGFLGITGFMYGAAVNILSHHWKHGEDLREWHNAKYNHSGKGVVNPAILTISS